MLELLGYGEYVAYAMAVMQGANLTLLAADRLAGVTEWETDDKLVDEGRKYYAKVRKFLRTIGVTGVLK